MTLSSICVLSLRASGSAVASEAARICRARQGEAGRGDDRAGALGHEFDLVG
jgi:hypothetical protein